MATQVSYPGIYIQEFTPGAPIQPVGTSTGAFIGTAIMGPVNTPTFLTSWDEFQTVFGGLIAEASNVSILTRSYLAPAVYGFFLNGGTGCYVVRAVPSAITTLMATADLPITAAVPSPVPTDLVVTAIAEGSIGNSISITAADSSRLAAMLSAAALVVPATVPLIATATVLTVTLPSGYTAAQLNAAFPSGSKATVSGGGLTETVIVAATSITAGVAEITIDSPGLVNAYNTATTVTATLGPTLQVPAALTAGLLSFQVTLPYPSTFVLSQALPTGAVIEVSEGGSSEFVTVAAAGPVTPGVGLITLTTALQGNYGAGASVASMEFNLTVTGATTEPTQMYLSMNQLHPGYWGTAFQSQYVTLSLPTTPPTYPAIPVVPDPNPAPGMVALKGGQDDNRVEDLSDIETNPTFYLNLLAQLQDVDIIAFPGITNANAQQALITHCETLRNRFAVLDAAPDSSVGYTGLQTQYGQVRTPDGFAAIYFPWIQVVNPLTGVTEYWPPSGHMMGIYALTDQNRGVYKAPANVPIQGALGLQSLLADADQGPLNLLGINILRVFPEQSQPLVWGARTTSTDSDWLYINVRRLFIYLEQSIEQGIRWAVFEPNNPMLWGKLSRTITEFLNRVEGDGGIQDFYVRIDAALNPPASQALGRLYLEVGIQPTYPAEFIILRIGIWQGGSSVTES